MRAHRGLDDREHAVRGDADEMRPRPQIVDDLLDRHDHAPPRGERAPDPFEQRRVERDVAVTVGDRCVHQRDIGHERREQPDLAERRVDARVRLVLLHRRARDRARHDRGQPARRGFEPLRERQERPVLDLDLTAFVRAREPRVGGEVGKRVARVTGDHLAHETAAEEQRAEAREREHRQREAGIAAPPLAHDLARRRGPARVPDDRMEHVAGVHVARDGVEREVALVRHARNLASRPADNLFIVVAHALTPDPAVARCSPSRRPKPGRRYRGLSPEERRADQRRRLVRAAIDEFAARGYHHTSVEDIVRSARTSRTAFYAFFDNREDAMYGALQTCLRGLLDDVRKASFESRRPATISSPSAIGAYVAHLVADPAAATIVLLEGVGTSPEVNALRSRIRRELADLIRDMWAEYDPEAAAAPAGRARSRSGVLGILFESMVHLVETDRLDEAPGARARARHRDRARLRTPPVKLGPMKLGIVTPALTLLPRAHATWEETATFADSRRRSCRRPSDSATTTARAANTSSSPSTSPPCAAAATTTRSRRSATSPPSPRRSASPRTSSCSATTTRSRSPSATARSTS